MLKRTFSAVMFILLLANTLTLAFNIQPTKAEAGLIESPWPMFHHDQQHTGRSPYNVAQTPALKWIFKTKDDIYSSPTIGADGTIYVASSDGALYAINPDGSLNWSIAIDAYFSSPTIGSDGTVYIGGADRSYALYAVDPHGTIKWRFTTGYFVWSSPTIGNDGTIYVGSADNKLYAINPDGTLKWSYTTGDWVTSSPAIGSDGTVYVGSWDDKLYAISPEGIVKWSYLTGDDVHLASPAIGSDGTIYVGSRDGEFYALDPNGSLKWKYSTSIIHSTPAIALDGTIYVGSYDHKLYALNPDGTLRWSYLTGDYVFSSPAIDADGTVYVGSADYNLYAINPDGTLNWTYMTDDSISSSPAIGNDGTIYVASNDGNLYAIGETHPQVIRVPDEYPTIQAAINAANTGDTVFVRTGTYYEDIVANKSLTISGENKDTTFVIGSPGGVVFVVESDNVRISGFTMQNGNAGIVASAQNVTITDNIITNSTSQGIQVSGARNTISCNFITNCGAAIIIYGNNQTIEKNVMMNNGYAIQLSYFSNNNRVTQNEIANNHFSGIYVQMAHDNSISDNTLTNNAEGIRIAYSTRNVIFHNLVINNTRQVFIDNGNINNTWDDGYPSGGNYWSDYNGTDIQSGTYQNETGIDGIGDTPYSIDTNNTDRYPLMKPYRTSSLPGDINHDGAIDISDAILAARAFGSSLGQPNWNSRADLNNDGIIDIFDLIILVSNFGKTTV